jgi:NAD(P)-dependent dehydrogenase (short-subunit alcohol dehydrogenase family)
MSDSFSPPVWFITGCSSGLGRALAIAALSRGDRVIATARHVTNLEALARAYPLSCRMLALDVTRPAEVESAVAAGLAAFGTIDVLVNNAGAGLVGAVEETNDAEIARSFEVNFLGPLRLTRALLPHFRARRAGHLFFLSAAAAIANYPGFGIYGAAKRALEGAAESLAQEGRPFGLKVTIVQPGPFRTDFIGRSLTHAATTLPDYDGTRGKFARFLASAHGQQPGDPARAASAIIAAFSADRSPLRLVLGAYANDKARRTLSAAQRELEAWASTSAATEFPHSAKPEA